MLPGVVEVKRYRLGAHTVALVLRVDGTYYRGELHTSGREKYISIHALNGGKEAYSGPAFASAALALGRALLSLAETGGGGIGRLLSSSGSAVPSLQLVLLGLLLVMIGGVFRRFACSLG